MNIRICWGIDGYPWLSEEGGGRTKTGWAQVIASEKGEKLEGLRRPRHANDIHILFDLDRYENLLVIQAELQGGSKGRLVLSMALVNISETFTLEENWLEPENVFFENLPYELAILRKPYLADAIDAAKEKCLCYHCRESHFSIEKN